MPGVTAAKGTAWIVEGKLNYAHDPTLRDKVPGKFEMYAVPLTKHQDTTSLMGGRSNIKDESTFTWSTAWVKSNGLAPSTATDSATHTDPDGRSSRFSFALRVSYETFGHGLGALFGPTLANRGMNMLSPKANNRFSARSCSWALHSSGCVQLRTSGAARQLLERDRACDAEARLSLRSALLAAVCESSAVLP
jgi:hypothetical protein